MITLRPYQSESIRRISEAFRVQRHRRVLFVLPTGGGKTVCFSYMVSRQAAAGKRVWVIAHRDELLTQISNSLQQFDIEHGVLRGGSKISWHDIQVCSVQTLVRRLNRLPKPDLIIIDEAHHAAAGSWKKIMEHHPDVYVLGVTATPVRLDGKGLASYFDHMVVGPTPQWLADNGFLSPPDIYAPELVDTAGIRTSMGDYDRKQLSERMDKPAIYGNAVEHYRKLAYGKRIIVFCVNLKHVEATLQAYRNAGIPAASIDGKMTPAERQQVNRDFESKRIWVLVSCEIINEGYDVPGCDGVQMLRPTQSLGLYLQQVGRGLRIAPGKQRAIILDHVKNWERHGHPLQERAWSLDAAVKRGKKSDDATRSLIRMCETCFVIMDVSDTVCPACGTPVVFVDRTPDQVDGELKLITPPASLSAEEKLELFAQARTLQDWHNVARRCGYKPQWAWIKHNESRKAAIDRAARRISAGNAPAHADGEF